MTVIKIMKLHALLPLTLAKFLKPFNHHPLFLQSMEEMKGKVKKAEEVP